MNDLHRVAGREQFEPTSRRRSTTIFNRILAMLAIYAYAVLCSNAGVPVVQAQVAADAGEDVEATRYTPAGSLSYIFYKDNPMPEPMGPDETKAIERLLSFYAEERCELDKILEQDQLNGTLLLLYAARRGSNGIPDFRIADDGKFFENDPDIDDDGIRNVLDVEPYRYSDGQAPDSDQDRVPDHIDFGDNQLTRARIQQALLDKYDITLVERTAEFTPRLARIVEDVVTKVFREYFTHGDGTGVLKTVATEKWEALVSPCRQPTDLQCPDHHEFKCTDRTKGLVSSQSNTMYIYGPALKSPRHFQMGLVIHEMAHVYQFSLDFDSDKVHAMRTENVYTPDLFYAELKPMGWVMQTDPENDPYIYSSYLPVDYEVEYSDEADEYYNEEIELAGWDIEKFYEYLSRRRKALKGGEYLDEPLAQDMNIVSAYSVKSPWEWHAENLLAYVYNGMEDHAETFCPDGHEELREAFREANGEFWAFGHQNARNSGAVREYFDTKFPISHQDWEYLTCNYLLPGCPVKCGDYRKVCKAQNVELLPDPGYTGCFEDR